MSTPLILLLADDDADDRFFFKKAVEAISPLPEFTTVSDGQKLMDYLNAHLDTLPTVIFLDLNMPRKNGLECLVEIKSNENLKHIPVVAYSTSLRDETADVLYDNGAHYYLHKCEYNLLSQNIMKILRYLALSPLQPQKGEFIINLQEA